MSHILSFGIYSCLGITESEVLHSLRNGIPAITLDPARTAYGYRSPLTTALKSPSPKEPPFSAVSQPSHPLPVSQPSHSLHHLTRAQRARLTPLTTMALHAACQALSTLGITTPPPDMALIVSCDSTCEPQAITHDQMSVHHRTAALGPHRVFQSLNSTVSMTLAEILHFSGLTLTVSAACAGGGHAVGLAHSLIKSGIISSALVIGAQENGLHAYTAFDALGIFAQPHDNIPTQYLSRPFSTDHCGLVPSGGAAAVLLSNTSTLPTPTYTPLHTPTSPTLPTSPLATILGYGFSTSPNIITPSTPSIISSITAAARQAASQSTNQATVLGSFAAEPLSHVTHIIPHATATIDGDLAEAAAIAHLFPPTSPTSPTKPYPPLPKPPLPYLLPLKSLTGHECWMSGVSQLVYTLIMKKHNFLAPNPCLTAPLPSISHLPIPTQKGLPFHPKATVPGDFVAGQISPLILLNSFGFGGTNATLLIS